MFDPTRRYALSLFIGKERFKRFIGVQNIFGRNRSTGARRQMREIDPLNFLKAVYMNAELPLSVRMRAAIELLPFTHPKLAVVAQVTENDIATLLDRRLKRIQQMEMKVIEAQPQPQTIEVRPSLPRVTDRRFRRM
jgi:hypothetical protein